jgi:hypothetical protein
MNLHPFALASGMVGKLSSVAGTDVDSFDTAVRPVASQT